MSEKEAVLDESIILALEASIDTTTDNTVYSITKKRQAETKNLTTS
jgi:hypothetical protein